MNRRPLLLTVTLLAPTADGLGGAGTLTVEWDGQAPSISLATRPPGARDRLGAEAGLARIPPYGLVF